MRFRWERVKDSKEIEIYDHLQGSVCTRTQSYPVTAPIAVVYDPELAEFMTSQLNLQDHLMKQVEQRRWKQYTRDD